MSGGRTVAFNAGLGVGGGGDINGDGFDDLVIGARGNDIMLGGSGADLLFGDEDDDVVDRTRTGVIGPPGTAPDLIAPMGATVRNVDMRCSNGGNGNDHLVGGRGTDILDGGAGADLYGFAPGMGTDTIRFAPSEADRIRIKGFGAGL